MLLSASRYRNWRQLDPFGTPQGQSVENKRQLQHPPHEVAWASGIGDVSELQREKLCAQHGDSYTTASFSKPCAMESFLFYHYT